MRFAIFTEKVKKIDEMNADPEDEAVYGINDFADWTHEEFKKLNGLIHVKTDDDNIESEQEMIDFAPRPRPPPASVDWRSKGVLNPIKS